MHNLKNIVLMLPIGLALISCGGGDNSGDGVIGVFEPSVQTTSQYDVKTKAGRDAFEKRLADAHTASIEWLANNSRKTNVITTSSGLQYQVNKASSNPNGLNYQAGQNVTVHYEGRLIDGTVFDSSFDRGRPETFKPSDLIQGWQEALNIMKPGDEWTLYIPPSLGYGDLGKGGGIPPNAVIVFDVELR